MTLFNRDSTKTAEPEALEQEIDRVDDAITSMQTELTTLKRELAEGVELRNGLEFQRRVLGLKSVEHDMRLLDERQEQRRAVIGRHEQLIVDARAYRASLAKPLAEARFAEADTAYDAIARDGVDIDLHLVGGALAYLRALRVKVDHLKRAHQGWTEREHYARQLNGRRRGSYSSPPSSPVPPLLSGDTLRLLSGELIDADGFTQVIDRLERVLQLSPEQLAASWEIGSAARSPAQQDALLLIQRGTPWPTS